MDNQDLQKLYANGWRNSSKYFFDKNYYAWMSEKIKDYGRILEVGCGVGYSTLQLSSEGHSVIAIEKNAECIKIANDILKQNGLCEYTTFVEGDIVLDDFRSRVVTDFAVDAVICWNPGTQMSAKILQSYVQYMVKYGLTIDQINKNPVSSYNEMFLWYACRLAKMMNVPFHVIDRCGEVCEDTRVYYEALGREVGYSYMQCDALDAETISEGGIPMIANGKVQHINKIPIVLVSVLFL